MALLVHNISAASMETVAGQLAEKLQSTKKDAQRDVAGLGLKAIIEEISASHPNAALIIKVVTPRMLQGMEMKVRGQSADGTHGTHH